MHKRLQTFIAVLLAFSLLQVMVVPMCAAAETLHYWRFEDGPGFLEDSVGGATLRAQNFDQVPLPSDGRGQNFPHDLPGIGSNESAADTPPGTAGLTSSRTTRIDDAFTIELFANIDDLSIDSLRSVLAAQATDCCSTSNFGWAFTVEIKGANGTIFNATWNSKPYELELFASDGQSIQLIPSGILLNENTDYFLSAAFDIDDDVRFYVVDLDEGSVQTSEVAHSLNQLHGDPYFQIGAPYPQLSLDGLLDEVRLSHGVVPIEELLVNLDQTDQLLAGDADQDLDFDQFDLVQVQIAAKYLTGQPATWGEGDWDGSPGGEPGSPPAGNGLFDQLDVITALAAGTYLTGPYATVEPNGQVSDGQTSVIYNAGTGEMAVDAPAGVELTSINIDSTAGIFTGEAAANLGGSFDNDAADNIFKATFGGSFGSLSFGNVAQAGLSEQFVLGDLSVIGSLAGGGDLGNVDLVYVPEPASVLLLSVGLVIGLIRIRRARH